MRTIDADELLEHVYRDKVDTREAIAEMVNRVPTVYEGGLIWLQPKYIPLHGAQNDLFLAWREGWPLCVCYWRTGYGWRRVDNNESFSPELVAHINLDI
jgi:hypothetical protein